MTAALPVLAVQAQFTPGTWSDITAYMRSFTVNRPVSRTQGPLWQYQAGTCSILLDNSDGRFDPDNLTGPYTSSTGLQQVVTVYGPGKSGNWTAPRNLSGTTIKVEAWGPGVSGTAAGGIGGGGGEYAAENSYTVIPGNSYAYVCPASSGSSTTFDGTGVVAHSASGQTGGTGSGNSIHFNGGAGGNAGTGNPAVGGGGGSSGGSTQTGNAGSNGNAGGQGGPAPLNGYAGGSGAGLITRSGQRGAGPGGGGGGGAKSTSGTKQGSSSGGIAVGGQIRLTYFVTITPSATVTQVLPMVPVQITATWPANFLTGQNTGFEGGIGNWTATGNSTVTGTSAQAHSGTSSLQISSVAAGFMAAADDTDRIAVYPGQYVAVSAWMRAAATPESVQVAADFYDAGSNLISTVTGPSAADTTTGWTRVTDGGQIIAPPGAATAAAKVEVVNTGGAAEVHYADDVTLAGFYPLFTGFADSWQEAAVNYSAGYSEFTLTCTDGFGILSQQILPALGSPVGSGEDSGARVARILDWAGWPPAARQIDTGDSNQQQTSFGSDALSLLQLTADTEIGELYINGAGNVVFRHRQAIILDTRSASPLAVFGDMPGTQTAQVTFHGDGTHSGVGIGAQNGAGFFPASTPVGKQVWVWSSAAYASGALLKISFFDATVTFISSVSGSVTATGTTPVLLNVSGTSPAGTVFANVSIEIQGTPASSVIFNAAAAPPVANEYPLPSATPWSPLAATTTITGTSTWSVVSGVPGELAFAMVGRADDNTTIANDVQITAAGSSNLQEAQDPVSQYIYQGPRSYARTDLLLASDTEALEYANWVLFISRNNEDRFDTLTIDPLADTTGLYPQVLGRDIGDRIQVWRRPSGFSAPVTKDVFIRGISHTFDSTATGQYAWSTAWTLQSAAKYGGFLTLDSTNLGLLDVNALVY